MSLDSTEGRRTTIWKCFHNFWALGEGRWASRTGRTSRSAASWPLPSPSSNQSTWGTWPHYGRGNANIPPNVWAKRNPRRGWTSAEARTGRSQLRRRRWAPHLSAVLGKTFPLCNQGRGNSRQTGRTCNYLTSCCIVGCCAVDTSDCRICRKCRPERASEALLCNPHAGREWRYWNRTKRPFWFCWSTFCRDTSSNRMAKVACHLHMHP